MCGQSEQQRAKRAVAQYSEQSERMTKASGTTVSEASTAASEASIAADERQHCSERSEQRHNSERSERVIEGSA